MTPKQALKSLAAKQIEVAPNVFLLKFKDTVEMGKVFIRFQEHYESPKFRGQVFTMSEFKAWYSKAYGKGHFTYYKDWSGYNFPSYILQPFYDGKFGRLSKREQLILDVFRGMVGPYYVIGAVDTNTLKHETAHGLFYTQPEYKAKVLKILSSLDYSPVKKILLDNCYCEAVLDDELNAYSIDGLNRYVWLKDIDLSIYRKASKKLAKLFDQYKEKK